ncbi:TIGR00282 family metallophosphoesterase [Bombella saccharophila]|uniref:YmdB family metallophosphoesterase n=1 Tax=Bombella saccharophila TaxID=2967338 RepID=A0ABT3W7W6_9PROT|nr:TIGR00282 family metallophosphoesterase [Bombella saccharophila]MCX5615172.1 YmdB family metallophosphoesterase [Bombella saccharophila]PHI96163.1 metallophosphoesterase [Parasaccharibacter apium]
MRLLFLGDIVGRSGRDAVLAGLKDWREQLSLDAVIANAENASHGFGLSPQIARDLLDGGVDVITLGNHAWDRKDLIGQLDQLPAVVRPANYPEGTPGQGGCVLTLPCGRKILVINVMGRIFMDALDDPFRAVDAILSRHRLGGTVHAAILDVHAETTSEKMVFGHHYDGRFSLIVGTHTHIPTADHRILKGGTAYQTDAGMCGDYDSVIGMEKENAIRKMLKKVPTDRFQPATGKATVTGLMVETDDLTGLAIRVCPFRHGGELLPSMPDF